MQPQLISSAPPDPLSGADASLMEEAKIPVDLRLSDVVFPDVEVLNRIVYIAHRYQWSTPQDALNADYNQVTADLANLSSLTLMFSDLESAVNLAYHNMVSNRDIVHAYHFSRLREEADDNFSQAMRDYKEKIAPKPEKITDATIKAKCEVLLSVLEYPKKLNRIRSIRDKLTKMMDRCDSLINVLKKLIDRASKYGG